MLIKVKSDEQWLEEVGDEYIVISFKLRVGESTDLTKLTTLVDFLEFYRLGNGVYGKAGWNLVGRVTLSSPEVEGEFCDFVNMVDVEILNWDMRLSSEVPDYPLDKTKCISLLDFQGGII